MSLTVKGLPRAAWGGGGGSSGVKMDLDSRPQMQQNARKTPGLCPAGIFLQAVGVGSRIQFV